MISTGAPQVPHRHWTLLESSTVSEHRIFRLGHDRYRLAPEGSERDFIVLDMPDWINVIALTESREVVLIRQFRHGVREVTLEVPGGMVDPGEDPQAAALRELREETGYAGETAHSLGHVWPNPAIQNNRCHTFLVEDTRRVGEPQLDPYERIEVDVVPLDDVPRLLREGAIRHALVVAAFAALGITAAG